MSKEIPKCSVCGDWLDGDRCSECEGPVIVNMYDAVSYMLDRVQRDADLRHYMLGTEAMDRLCKAEAMAAGWPYREVKSRRYLNLQPPHRQRHADIVVARERLEKIQLALRDSKDPLRTRQYFDESELRAALDKIEELLVAGDDEIMQPAEAT